MARHYSTRNFFRQIPNALLACYFHERERLTDLDFAATKETKPDALFAAWLELPEEQRKPMDAEFQDIFELSCEKRLSQPCRRCPTTITGRWLPTWIIASAGKGPPASITPIRCATGASARTWATNPLRWTMRATG